MQEPVYVLHLITCHGRIMPELLLASTSAQSQLHYQKPPNTPRTLKIPKYPVKQTKP